MKIAEITIQADDVILACFERSLFRDAAVGTKTEAEIEAALNTMVADMLRGVYNQGHEEISRRFGVKDKLLSTDTAKTIADVIVEEKAKPKPGK